MAVAEQGGWPPTPSTSFTGKAPGPGQDNATWEVPPPCAAPPPEPSRLRKLPQVDLGLTERAHTAAFYWRIPAPYRALIGGAALGRSSALLFLKIYPPGVEAGGRSLGNPGLWTQQGQAGRPWLHPGASV